MTNEQIRFAHLIDANYRRWIGNSIFSWRIYGAVTNDEDMELGRIVATELIDLSRHNYPIAIYSECWMRLFGELFMKAA